MKACWSGEALGTHFQLERSVTWKVLNSERSRRNTLGPLRVLRPLVPNTPGPTGCVKLAVLNQGTPGPMPCRISTGATWFAVCDSPGVFRHRVGGDVKRRPSQQRQDADTCHPPMTLEAMP